ncbi:MAG: hypothetical protein WC637_10795 [Victivallales bacterium]
MRTFRYAILLLFLATAVCGQTIDVMITGQNIRSASPFLEDYREACAKEGVNVNFVLHGGGLDYTAITLDMMKKFHVIVFHGQPGAMSSCKGTEEQVAAFRDRLEEYRKLGGGILWTPTSFTKFPREWNEKVGVRYGAKLLAEDLYDPAKTVDVNPGMKKKMFTYLWTTDISPHPVTEGVKGLFLPTVGEWSWPGTVPVEFGPDWKVLIRAMDTTRTIGNSATAETVSQFSPDVKGSVASAPAVLGVREDKGAAGRMMIFPIYSAHTFQNFGHFVFSEALMVNGADGHPSDGHKLLLNAYRWLAAPAQKAGLGGYKGEKRTAAAPNRSPVAWSAMKPLPDGSLTGDKEEMKSFPGLIGLRTAAGGGAGTVNEYAKEAKRLGLSFIVFLEDAAKLSPAGFQKLVKDCADASNADFLAIPGYSFMDVPGNSLFIVNAKKAPDKDFMTKEGRVLNYWGLMMQEMGAGIGLRRLGAAPVDPQYYFWITSAAPYTWENNKLADDGFERYRMIQGLGHAYAGVAIAEVSSPSDLESASRAAHKTVVHASTLDQVRDCLVKRSFPYNYPVYMTNGPRLEHWAVRQAESDSLRAGGERFRLELGVTGDANLKEVTIVNCQTGKPYRTFRPNGTRTFSCTVDEAHKTQMYFIPVVTDVNGRTAVGSMIFTGQSANKLYMMTDRLMGMHHSRVYDSKKQQKFNLGGWLGSVTWVKRSNHAGGYPSTGDESQMRIFGFDGGKVFPGAVDFGPNVSTADGNEPIFPGYRFRNRLASFDIALMDFDGQLQFDKAYSNDVVVTSLPIPAKLADISSREWSVRPRAGAATASNVHEITALFKQATTFKIFNVCYLRRWDKANPCHWFIRDSAGEVDKLLEADGKFSRKGTLRPGDYLYPANEIGGPTGIINLGPAELQYAADGRGAKVFIDGKSQAVQTGASFTARLVCFSRERSVQNDGAWLKKFVSDFGIGTEKPGYSLTVSQGDLRSGNYLLDLAAVKGGAAIEIKKYELPHNVAVRVGGIPANAIAGSYDFDRKHLLVLPVFEEAAMTSINTTLGDTKLYVGELFHCDSKDLLLSCVQTDADKLLLELHNPTDRALKAKVAAVPGFTPLAGLDKTLDIPPFSSVKMELPAVAGSILDNAYEGD